MALPATKTESARRRLPVDCWRILKRLQEQMGSAPYQTVVILCFRVCKQLKDANRLDLLSPPAASEQETESGRIPLSDNAWVLLREFSRFWGGTSAPATIANSVRIVDSLSGSPRLPKKVQATLEVLGIM